MTLRTTRSGIPFKDFYSAEDWQSQGRGEAPGTFPYTRGRRGNALPMGNWIQRELSGEGDAKRSNQQLLELDGARTERARHYRR